MTAKRRGAYESIASLRDFLADQGSDPRGATRIRQSRRHWPLLWSYIDGVINQRPDAPKDTTDKARRAAIRGRNEVLQRGGSALEAEVAAHRARTDYYTRLFGRELALSRMWSPTTQPAHVLHTASVLVEGGGDPVEVWEILYRSVGGDMGKAVDMAREVGLPLQQWQLPSAPDDLRQDNQSSLLFGANRVGGLTRTIITHRHGRTVGRPIPGSQALKTPNGPRPEPRAVVSPGE